MIYIFILSLSIFSVLETTAQNSYYDSVFSANENIYKFQYQSADSAIQKLKTGHPDDYLPMLLSANYYWWRIISGDGTSKTRNNYYVNLNKSLSLLGLGKKPVCSNDSLYAIITTFAYLARIHSMNNRHFSALKQLNNCIEFVKKSFGKESEYEWFLLTSGLYNYYIEAVKKNYPFLRPYLIFLPEGNVTAGISFLKRAGNSENVLLSTEATYFLIKIYLEEEKKYSLARIYSAQLIKKFPANLLYRYYQFKSYLEEKNIEDATKELGLLMYHAEKNPQLTETQKSHFQIIAREDLKKFYLKEKK